MIELLLYNVSIPIERAFGGVKFTVNFCMKLVELNSEIFLTVILDHRHNTQHIVDIRWASDPSPDAAFRERIRFYSFRSHRIDMEHIISVPPARTKRVSL